MDHDERFRFLAEHSCDLVAVLSPESSVLYASPAARTLLGCEPDELAGRSFLELVHPEDLAAAQKFHAGLMAPPFESASRLRLRADGGRFMRLECAGRALLRGPGGPVREMLVVVRSRDLARVLPFDDDAGLRAAGKHEFPLADWILRYVGALVLVADSAGRIAYVSPSVRTILGYEPEELLGEGWWNLVHEDPEERERQRGLVLSLLAQPRPSAAQPYETMVRHRNGEPRWMAWQDALGPEGTIIGVGHDVTQRKQLERQLWQSQKMEAVGTLAGGIAHDFNNLLTAINGYSELVLARLPDHDPLRPLIQDINRAGERAASLTRQLLAFSRKQFLRPQAIDLNDVVYGIRDMLCRLMGEDTTVTIQTQPELGLTRADPAQIEQVIVNLALNARDAMPNGGRLTIHTAAVETTEAFLRDRPGMQPGSYVSLTVADNGCGMAPEVQAHVFEPFFTTKEVGKGTGLGLSTAYGIIKQSGGYIYFWSAVGRGTAFHIYLPRMEK
jgi:two-component system cell cycle sensor histidine kinase/response regulator CckA